jgi:serine/threonine-protein kinase
MMVETDLGLADLSALTRLAARIGPLSRVLLPETEAGMDATGVNLGVRDGIGQGDGAAAGIAGRYRLLGEIARGGMGAVLRGHDTDLGRDLALKILLDQHQGRGDLIKRFVEEAQICGQLQHPGVVPVYELGTLGDDRPYFTMKLVKGRTLEALLQERGGPQDDLPRFLGIFEAVCQTVAYAHSRGVIHRDLKPSNVMVGSFGEVQVMDWGLAKVLPRDVEASVARRLDARNETVVATVGSLSDRAHSESGSVLGTPAYMAPEQARGENEDVDRRADVFALGSILCAILTGEPAFTGSSAREILLKAGRANLTDALARLDRCGAEPELTILARDALAAEAAGRPADAGVLARRMTDYLAGVQERLRSTELARAAESARADEARATAAAAEARVAAERRARRLTAALAATVLLAGGLGGAAWRWVELERMGRAREAASRVNAAVHEATRLRGQALGAAVGDLAPWTAAVAAAGNARDLLVVGVEPGLRRQVEDLAAAILAERGRAQEAADAAERDRRLLDLLADIRSAKADDRLGDGTDAAYASAFRADGIDPDALTPKQAGDLITSRPPETAAAMAMALDDWAAVRRDLRNDAVGARRLADAARLADPDPWRSGLRDALEIADRPARRARLIALAGSIKGQVLPPVSFDLLGKALGDVSAKAEAGSVLAAGRRLYPGDLWLNYDLARALEKLARRDEAIRYYTAARMIRPETAHELAHALRKKGESEEAIGVFRDLARIRPRSGRHLSCMGQALLARGLRDEARRKLDEAVVVLRETIAARPDDYYAHLQLANSLLYLERLDEALEMYRKTAILKPGHVDALIGIGATLIAKNRHSDAEALYRDALRLSPDNASLLEGLGTALQELGRVDEAIEVCRRAILIAPDDFAPHYRLGAVLALKGRYAEALAERQEAVRLTPDDSTALYGLGQGFRDTGRFVEAEGAFRKALENQPDDSFSLNSLAWELLTAPDRRRRPEEALELARRAVAQAPAVATNYNTLGLAEYRNGHWDRAIAALKKSIELNHGTDPTDDFFLAMTHWRRGEKDEAERSFARGVEGARKGAPGLWEWRKLWAEAAELLQKPRPVPTLYEVNADPDGSMTRLRRMMVEGVLQVESLRTSPDLAPLRSRDDFRLLLIDLAMPAQPFAPER